MDEWFPVYANVLGPKLRGLRKELRVSDSEALGILMCFWIWAKPNTDQTGELFNTDRDDIAMAITPFIKKELDAKVVVKAMIAHRFIDDNNGVLRIHNWGERQSYWYRFVNKLEKDRDRKRDKRADSASSGNATRSTQESTMDASYPNIPTPEQGGICNPEESSAPQEQNPDHTPPPSKKPKSKGKSKVKYADKVSMTEDEYQKLIAEYGEEATQKLIWKLNVYKVSSGRNYKSDYGAILNWVVFQCTKDFPELFRNKSLDKRYDLGEDPFAGYI